MARAKRELTPEQQEFRRRKDLLKRILRNYALWQAYYEDEGLTVITIEGEEWHFLDILSGIEQLPERQRQALWLYCVEDMRQVDVAKQMGFEKWSTPVQQYRSIALTKLVQYHDERNSSDG